MYTIVYEDDLLLVVNKEAGVSVCPDAHHIKGTLLQSIQKIYPRAELAHRLDKETSGLLVVAKNHTAHMYAKELFKKRQIKKTYIALVAGVVLKNEGEITLPITRSKKDFRKHVVSPKADESARPAETHFKVLERFPELNYTLVEVHPQTGRTHQIRSHMASIGYPIACDALYGGKRYMCPAGLTRQFLHAAGLEFTTLDGKRIRLEADLPQDLTDALRTIKMAT